MNPLTTTSVPSAARASERAERSTLDSHSIRRLKALGLLNGWRCAVVGAGAGSVALWLAERVGRPGRVVAADAQTLALESLRREGLEIRAHDIAGAALEAEFDIVFTRVSAHYLMQRDRRLRNMAASLRPGGWLLVEELDLGPVAGFLQPATDVQTQVNDALRRLLAHSTAEARDGMPVPAALRAHGLQDVQVQARATLAEHGLAPWEGLLFQLGVLRERLVGGGLLPEDLLDRGIEEARGYSGAVHEGASIAATWGRRPVQGV